MIPRWNKVPAPMRTKVVREYYDSLIKKKKTLVLKRAFDIVFSIILILILAIPMIIIAIMIKVDSKGPIIYKQKRVTQYGRVFPIYKFRTMVDNADKMGAHVTTANDSRITNVGKKLRKSRLDEFPQLFNVLKGEMSFVGTRPEAIRYVSHYTDEMMATLLLPAGVTSMTSVEYKDEDELLSGAEDPDKVYVEKILPEKMKYNLKYVKDISIMEDIRSLFVTVKRVV